MKKSKIKKNKNASVVLAVHSVKSQPFYVVILALWSIYLYLILISPNTSASQQLHLSHQTLDLLRLTIAVPYLLIWLAATYSYIQIKRYATAISPSRESCAFHTIATGILFLLGSLILSTFASAMRNVLGDSSQIRPLLTILTNYAYVFPYLFAFIFLYRSARELLRQHVMPNITFSKIILYGIPIIALMYIWLELIFTNPYRATPGTGSEFATYYLRDSLLILTLIIPSLMSWAIGLLAVIKLKIYHKKVSGSIYEQSLSSLINGLIGVIAASVFLQALLSLGSQRLLDLGLGKVLGVIYLFLLIQGLGFFFIARGANKLTKIESV